MRNKGDLELITVCDVLSNSKCAEREMTEETW